MRAKLGLLLLATMMAWPATAQDGEGLPLYIGIEYADLTFDVSNDQLEADFGNDRFDSQLYALRLGTRLFNAIGAELQLGAGDSASGTDEVEVSQYAGFYFVPTGTIANAVEVSVRVGYSFLTLEGASGAEEDVDGLSYGLGMAVPFRLWGEGMPNLRLNAGGTVYSSERETRTFSWHAGLRYDFFL